MVLLKNTIQIASVPLKVYVGNRSEYLTQNSSRGEQFTCCIRWWPLIKTFMIAQSKFSVLCCLFWTFWSSCDFLGHDSYPVFTQYNLRINKHDQILGIPSNKLSNVLMDLKSGWHIYGKSFNCYFPLSLINVLLRQQIVLPWALHCLSVFPSGWLDSIWVAR